MQGTDLSSVLPFNPDRPATAKPPTTDELVRELSIAVTQLADTLTPGIPGITGTQEIPEGQNAQLTITTANSPFPYMGNQKRSSLVIYNVGPSPVEFFYHNERNQNYTYGQGQPIPVGGEREIRTRMRIYLVSNGTSDLRIAEEAS